MTEQPLVSIIIPCYNAEKYAVTCINSVILQDYENWECIIINDGSKDSTLEIIQTFEDKDTRIHIFTQENLGLSATRNRGIENAKGKFIFFLDSDDVLNYNTLSNLIKSFEDNDIITGITVTTTFDGEKMNKISQLLHPKEGEVNFCNNNFEVLIRTMETGLTPVAQNRLYRKEFIDENQVRFKSGILHEDELWFFETMLFAKNVKFINEETYFYRIDNQDSITNNVGDRNLASYIQVMQDIITKHYKQEHFSVIANWYAVYIKKIFLDFAIRERSRLSDYTISNLELALRDNYIPLGNDHILSKNNEMYYKTINKLSLQDFSIIKKYFFRNPINSIRKIYKQLMINYLIK